MTHTTAPTALHLDQIAHAAGFRHFDFDGCYQGSLSAVAERVTAGRTHYFDAGTRRYFGCRVLEMSRTGAQTVLIALESVTPPSGSKAYRVVVFDVAGTTVYRTGNTDEQNERHGIAPSLKYTPGQFGHATKARALAEYRAVRDVLTPSKCAELLRGAISTELRAAQRRIDDLTGAFAALNQSAT